MKKNLQFILGIAMMYGGLSGVSAGTIKAKTRSARKTRLQELEDTLNRPSDEAWEEFIGYDLNRPGYSFVVDTRDFRIKRFKPGVFTLDDIPRKVLKAPHLYIIPAQELVTLLDRLYTESGGEGSWRMLTLKDQFRTLNWELKYIRIYPYEDGYLVCNTDNFVFSRRDLQSPVNQEYLHHNSV